MSNLTCWQCGVEPLDLLDVTTLSEATPRYMAGRWPPGDHEHAVDPPTPGDLAAASDGVRARMLRNLAS